MHALRLLKLPRVTGLRYFFGCTQCFREISVVIDNCNIGSVFILSNFNVPPSELFWEQLIDFCNCQNFICADVEELHTAVPIPIHW